MNNQKLNTMFVVNVPYPFGMAATMRIKLFAEYLMKRKSQVQVLVRFPSNGANKNSGIHNDVNFSILGFEGMSSLLFRLLYPFLVAIKLYRFRDKASKNVIVIYEDIDLFALPFVIWGKIFGCTIIIDSVEDSSLTDEALTFGGKVNLLFSKIVLPYIKWIVDGVIVISSTIKSKYIKYVDESRIRLISVSAANIQYDSNLIAHDNQNIKIVYSGSFGIKDGVEYLIDAFDQVSEIYEDALLLLYGEVRPGIEEKVAEIDNSKVMLVGYLSDAEYFRKLQEADILCMTRIDSPFAQAGFPFKLGEYLATGKAVIATDVSDISHYLQHNVDCVIAKPSDVSSIVTSLKYLLESKKRRDKIGKRGYKKAFTYFNPEVNGEILFDFITQL